MPAEIDDRPPSTFILQGGSVYAPTEERVTYPTRIKRKMFEEMTGEPFEYWEDLDIYQDYVPDKKDADVPVSTRALADLALVFFNTNEFIYLY